MIEVKDIEFSYGSCKVLYGIDFVVDFGDWVGIFGPNGAGKTTLLKIITGLLKPYKGKVLINGKEPYKMSRSEAVKLVTYVPPVLNSEFAYTTYEFIEMGMGFRPGWKGLNNKEVELIDDILNELKLQGLKGRVVKELSSGEQKMVLLARALLQDAPVILLDEPLANLDMGHAVQFMDTLDNIRKQRDVTILMVSHEVNLPLQYIDRVLLIDHTQKGFGNPEEVMLYPVLKETFNTEIFIDRNPINKKLYMLPMRRT